MAPVLVLSALLTACVVVPVGRHRGGGEVVGTVAYEPPAPRIEVVGVAPSAGYVWIGGNWRWGGNGHVWVPGRWEAGRPGYRWEPHRWEREGHGWREVPGRWSR